MSTTNERLKEIRKELGITQKEFADTLGITQGSYSLYESQSRTLKDYMLKSLAERYGINPNWISTGEGPKMIECKAYVVKEQKQDESVEGINVRLKQLRRLLGLGQAEMSKVLSIGQASYSHLELGKRHVKDGYVNTLVRIYGVRESWLRNGVGEVFEERKDYSNIQDEFDKLSEENKAKVFEFIKSLQ